MLIEFSGLCEIIFIKSKCKNYSKINIKIANIRLKHVSNHVLYMCDFFCVVLYSNENNFFHWHIRAEKKIEKSIKSEKNTWIENINWKSFPIHLCGLPRNNYTKYRMWVRHSTVQHLNPLLFWHDALNMNEAEKKYCTSFKCLFPPVARENYTNPYNTNRCRFSNV